MHSNAALPSPSDPADVARRLRAYIASHGIQRRELLRQASDIIRLADALAWLASDAYQLADRLADAAGDQGAVISRLRRDAAWYEHDATRLARQRPLARKLHHVREAA